MLNKIDAPLRFSIYEPSRFGIQVEEGNCHSPTVEGATRSHTSPPRISSQELQNLVLISPQGHAGFTIKYLCQDLNSTYASMTVPTIIGEDAPGSQRTSFTVCSALLDDIPLPMSAGR